MTTRVRRRARRRKPNHVSHILAAIWGNRAPNLGAIASDLLGQNRLREVVPVALLLESLCKSRGGSQEGALWPRNMP